MMTHTERMFRFEAAGLYLVTSQELSAGRTTIAIVRAALAGGARLFQLREKTMPLRELMTLGHAVRALTRASGALLIVNDRVDVALALDADGVHLGQSDLPIDEARRIAPELIVGASAHDAAEAEEAQRQGASYVNIGPLFATATKRWDKAFLGIEELRRIVPRLALPFTVMGGINRDRVASLTAEGARTLAVVTAVTAATDPQAAVAELLAAIHAGRQAYGVKAARA